MSAFADTQVTPEALSLAVTVGELSAAVSVMRSAYGRLELIDDPRADALRRMCQAVVELRAELVVG